MKWRELNEAENTAIEGVIDKIWDQYDVDNSGQLEKDEIKMFLINSLKELRSGSDFSQEAFDQVFSDLDKDESGSVEKPEMIDFLKQYLKKKRICLGAARHNENNSDDNHDHSRNP